MAVGFTLRLPVEGTGPMPLMLTPVALRTLQLSVVELPLLIVVGLALKLRMVGTGAVAGGADDATTATTVEADDVPELFVASMT